MKRLPSKFGNILKTIKTEYDLTEKSYKKMNLIYRDINKLLNKNECEIYDLNKILSEYNINGTCLDTVEKLRKFVKNKNKKIIKKALKSPKWSECINNLKNNSKDYFKDNIPTEIIEKSLIQVLGQYNKNWLGYWSIIDIKKSGSIKDIHLISSDDQNKLLYYISKNSGKLIIDKTFRKNIMNIET